MPAFEPSAALEELAGIIGGTGRTTISILERHGYRTRECVKDYESSRQVTLFTKVDSLGVGRSDRQPHEAGGEE